MKPEKKSIDLIISVKASQGANRDHEHSREREEQT
jgi:hypothetical protein